MILARLHKYLTRSKGSAFTVLLGGVALTALLSFTAYRVISGPVKTMTDTSNTRITDVQFLSLGRIMILDTINNADDCDSDGYVEPVAYTDNAISPVGGGIVTPSGLGIPSVDVWGSNIGYCVWDVETVNDVGCGGAGQNRLEGDDDLSSGGESAHTVFAFISAGPNQKFETTCSDHANDTTDLVSSAAGSDDFIRAFSYDAAVRLSGNLWSFKPADTSVVETQYDINVSSNIGTFVSDLSTTGRITAGGGLQLGTESDGAACSGASDEGTFRYHTTNGIELCNGTSWLAIGAGAGASYGETVVTDVGTDCGTTAAAGDINYNQTSKMLEFCDGTAWRELYAQEQNTSTGYFEDTTLAASAQTFTLAAPGFPKNTANRTVTFRYYAGPSIGPITVDLTNTKNFEIMVDNCTGETLGYNDSDTGISCTVDLRAKTEFGINGDFQGLLVIKDTSNVFTEHINVAVTGYCEAGTDEEGGIVIGCTEDFKYVGMELGCGTVTTNPVCDGNRNNSANLQAATSNSSYATLLGSDVSAYDGAANTTAMASDGGPVDFPAAEYCDDLVHNGHSDWYLPANSEVALLLLNADVVSDAYLATYGQVFENFFPTFWTSSTATRREDGTLTDGSTYRVASFQHFIENNDKTDLHHVVCFRKVAR